MTLCEIEKLIRQNVRGFVRISSYIYMNSNECEVNVVVDRIHRVEEEDYDDILDMELYKINTETTEFKLLD